MAINTNTNEVVKKAIKKELCGDKKKYKVKKLTSVEAAIKRGIKFADDNGDGVWRTIKGKKIFIKKGQNVEDAIQNFAKHTKKKIDEYKAEKTSKSVKYSASVVGDMRKLIAGGEAKAAVDAGDISKDDTQTHAETIYKKYYKDKMSDAEIINLFHDTFDEKFHGVKKGIDENEMKKKVSKLKSDYSW